MALARLGETDKARSCYDQLVQELKEQGESAIVPDSQYRDEREGDPSSAPAVEDNPAR
jgi:hypothetical protein